MRQKEWISHTTTKGIGYEWHELEVYLVRFGFVCLLMLVIFFRKMPSLKLLNPKRPRWAEYPSEKQKETVEKAAQAVLDAEHNCLTRVLQSDMTRMRCI
jgi:hypothetical protein